MTKTTFRWTIDPQQSAIRISSGIRNKALRIALNAGASPVKQAVIQSAPKAEGHLAKSTKIKVKNYKSGDVWVAIVGAGSNYKKLKKAKGKVVRKKGQKQYVRPALYQHLVDKGTKKMSGRRYLKSAFRSSQKQFEARARMKLKEVLEQLMRK